MRGNLGVSMLMTMVAGLGLPPHASFADDDPLVLRRQTLIVRDIDRSLKLYRDAIGMTVIYDQVIRRPHKTEKREQQIRLVFLKATSDFIGVLGLVDYEHNNPAHPSHTKPVLKEGFSPGHAVVLFNTTDLDRRWAAITKAPGIEVLNPPMPPRADASPPTGPSSLTRRCNRAGVAWARPVFSTATWPACVWRPSECSNSIL